MNTRTALALVVALAAAVVLATTVLGGSGGGGLAPSPGAAALVPVADGPGPVMPPSAPLAIGSIPDLVNFQGLLTDPITGEPIGDGMYSVRFSVWDAAAGGAEQWNETQTVQVTNGLFSVLLGTVTPLTGAAFDGDPRYLEAQVGADPPLAPRQRFVTVPYAFFAEVAHELQALRVEDSATSPNLIGGFDGNSVTAGAVGAAISGGGASSSTNRVTDNYGAVGGGSNNRAGDDAGATNNRPYGTVGGGASNRASGTASTVSGGASNTASALDATVGGGAGNIADGSYATVGGGNTNVADADYATISGGGRSDPGNAATGNRVTDDYGTVGGGGNNQAGDDGGSTDDAAHATVAGGVGNSAEGTGAAVGGGSGNVASSPHSTVSGGESNGLSGEWGSIGGGQGNTVNANYGVIGGGSGNFASFNSTIAGGLSNNATGTTTAIGGGQGNMAIFTYGTIAGGLNNTAGRVGGGPSATVGGGEGNEASDLAATVAGGGGNTASGGWSTVGGGQNNTAAESTFILNGGWSTVPGGRDNAASGDYSFAAGRRAKADHPGSFVWGDSTDADVASSADNEFTARTSGGARFFSSSNLSTGVKLDPGDNAWEVLSDRAVKENFASVDPRLILDRLVDIPIEEWNYTAQDDSIRHLGPTAQDFYAAFGLSDGDGRYISPIDTDGVALAAIQGLYEIAQEQQAEIEALRGGQGVPAAGDRTVAPTGAGGMPLAWALLGGLALLNLGVVLGVVGRRMARRRPDLPLADG